MSNQDTEILRKVLDGKTGAYSEIFIRHRERAYALAYQYVRNREDAKDLVQDAFIKAYQNLSRFDLGRKFGPWLLTIVRNLSIDFLRKRRRALSDDLPDTLPDHGSTETGVGRVLRMEIWAALQKLSPDHREIVFLKDYQGHSYHEIAEILEIPLGTVMSRLHHARKKLIEALGITKQ